MTSLTDSFEHQYSKMDGNHALAHFYVVGISHKKADATVRGNFVMGDGYYEGLLSRKDDFGVREFFVLSTCNRTELYGVAESAEGLIQLLLTQTKGSEVTFRHFAYTKGGRDAVRHLFEVAAGLDSQVLGDYEIVGQIRKSVKIARTHRVLGTFMDRLLNAVFQSSKSIKNQTRLSAGAVSLSHTAIRFLNQAVPGLTEKRIALIGTGQFGRSIGRYLVDYLQVRHLTVSNRTLSRAVALSMEWGASVVPLDQLPELLVQSDVIILATDAPEPLVRAEQLIGAGDKVLLDLSVPANLEKQAAALPNVLLIGLDDLCERTDTCLSARQGEVPHAQALLDVHVREFMDWCAFRKYAPLLHNLCRQLQTLQNSCERYAWHSRGLRTVEIQKRVNAVAFRIKEGQNPGCNLLQAMSELIQLTP